MAPARTPFGEFLLGFAESTSVRTETWTSLVSEPADASLERGRSALPDDHVTREPHDLAVDPGETRSRIAWRSDPEVQVRADPRLVEMLRAMGRAGPRTGHPGQTARGTAPDATRRAGIRRRMRVAARR